MNKLLLSSRDDLSNLIIDKDTELVLNLEDSYADINIITEKNISVVLLDMCKNTKNRIHIVINNNTNVIYNKVGINSNDNIEILLNGQNANLKLNVNVINQKDTSLCEKIVHVSESTTSIINNRGINYSENNLNINVDVIVNKEATFSNSSQKNNIISMSNGKNYISPNLIVDNDDVSLSHSAYVGDFDKQSIFYLKSRGIPIDKCKEILTKSFFMSNLDLAEEYTEKVIDFLKI